MDYKLKPIITILICLIPFFSKAQTTYYVSATGSDANNGTSIATPWQTIPKVNSITKVAGDQILFNRGDVFYGTITVPTSGSSGSPITYGAYGTGPNPVITGLQTLSWTLDSTGIYKATVNMGSTPEVVMFNDKTQQMGRFPNSAFRTYTASSGISNIFDAGITGNWVGAEAVIRKTRWQLDRNVITSIALDTIRYNSASTVRKPTPGYGYFIQNSKATLDSLGEWYYSDGTLYMYFGANNPTSYTVKVAAINDLFYASSKSYVTIKNIDFSGANGDGIHLSSSTNFVIDSCSFSYLGNMGVDGGWGSISTTVTNSSFRDIYSSAILFNNNCANAVIRNNTIDRIGLIPGTGHYAVDADDFSRDGIVIGSNNNSLAEYNNLDSVGHIGIRMGGQNDTIRFNTVNRAGMVRNDVGGIYAWSGGSSMAGTLIANNRITNVRGTRAGFPSDTAIFTAASGIYVDGSPDITINKNFIANSETYGIIINGGNGAVYIHDNTILNSRYSGIGLNSGSTGSISGVNITRNKIIAQYPFTDIYGYGLSGQPINNGVLDVYTTATTLPAFGVMDSNYFARPVDTNKYINTTTASDTWKGIQRTLADWRVYSGLDLHTQTTTKKVSSPDSITYEYNATTSPVTKSLPYKYLDIDGTVYNGSVTLQPYTGVVMIQDGSITGSTTPPPSISMSGPQSITVNYTSVSAVANPASGQTITGYQWTGAATFGSPTSASTTVTGLVNGTTILTCTATQSDNQKVSGTVSITVNVPVNPPTSLIKLRYPYKLSNY